MSRHRIVRAMDYNDEIEGYDDIYGHSVDDESCISPTDAQQWLYDRARGQQSISAFMANNRDIQEENEDEIGEENGVDYDKARRDSETFQMPVLDDLEQAKLISCIDEIRSVVGDTVSDKQIVESSMKYNYDVTKALDSILNVSKTPPKDHAKCTKEPIEKDFKTYKLSGNLQNNKNAYKHGQIDGNIQSLPGNIENKSKLCDFLNTNSQKLDNNASTSKTKFVLPKVNFCTSESNSNSKKSKLSQLVSSQLSEKSIVNTGTSAKGFAIPKLFKSCESSNTTCNNLSPLELSLQKIMLAKTKKNDIDEVSEKLDDMAINTEKKSNTEYIINLTQAINIQSETVPSVADNKISNQFRNLRKRSSDISEIKRRINAEISALLEVDNSDCLAPPTGFSKILCSKEPSKKILFVKHEFQPKNEIKPFKFDTKSPDEKFYQQINRNFQKT